MSGDSLAVRVATKRVSTGRLAAWWLGGSGFIFKTPEGLRIYIDPYLSNAVKDLFGVDRAFPSPIEPEAVEADYVISTHWHEDHLDPVAIPLIARHCPEARFIMPPSAMARTLSWGVSRERILPLRYGETLELGKSKITAIPARHEAGIPGWEVPDAMGILLDAQGIVFYHSGDTEYDLRLRALKSREPDVATICINGVSGNMDAHEAALLAWQIGAKTVIPHHHCLWAGPPASGATLDPCLFEATYRKLEGAGRVIIPEIGREMEFRKSRVDRQESKEG
jgi:L-ascorbate 6-phosphate lactonase